MEEKKELKEQLHEIIVQRQSLIRQRKELYEQISLIEAKLLLADNQNNFYKEKLKKLKEDLIKTQTKLKIVSEKCNLLFTKLRIVRINLKNDSFLGKIAIKNNKLSEAINELDCYGCIETGEIFEGPQNIDAEIPISSLDKFEKSVKKYQKNIHK